MDLNPNSTTRKMNDGGIQYVCGLVMKYINNKITLLRKRDILNSSFRKRERKEIVNNTKDNLTKFIPFPKQMFCDDEHLFCQNKALNEFVWEEYGERRQRRRERKRQIKRNNKKE